MKNVYLAKCLAQFLLLIVREELSANWIHPWRGWTLFPSYTSLLSFLPALYPGPVGLRSPSPPRGFVRTTGSLENRHLASSTEACPAGLRDKELPRRLPLGLFTPALAAEGAREQDTKVWGDHSLSPHSSRLAPSQKSVLSWTMLWTFEQDWILM